MVLAISQLIASLGLTSVAMSRRHRVDTEDRDHCLDEMVDEGDGFGAKLSTD